MAEPHLSSLTIKGFRCFETLELRKLGHVNLLVGKNGVGKSSVLDAVRLYASQFEFSVLADVLELREETWDKNNLNCLAPLFHGRPDLSKQPGHIFIGEMQFVAALAAAPYGEMNFRDTLETLLGPYGQSEMDDGMPRQRIPIVLVLGGPKQIHRQATFTGHLQYENAKGRPPSVPFQFVGDCGLGRPQVERLADEIGLSDRESLVTEAMRLVRSDIERYQIEVSPTRRVRVKLRGAKEPVFLASLGTGAQRIFGIALALVNAKDGFLLVDEFENGIHHSVQAKAWDFVLRVARELNVQVFAATHSQDCLAAFSQAASAREDVIGTATRIEEKNGEYWAYQFDEEVLGMATRESIEVR